MDVLPTAISLLDNLSAAHFSHISNILSHDVIGLLMLYFKLIFVNVVYFLNLGTLLPELVINLIFLQTKVSCLLVSADIVTPLREILFLLDSFNAYAPGGRYDEETDLSWAGEYGELTLI